MTLDPDPLHPPEDDRLPFHDPISPRSARLGCLACFAVLAAALLLLVVR